MGCRYQITSYWLDYERNVETLCLYGFNLSNHKYLISSSKYWLIVFLLWIPLPHSNNELKMNWWLSPNCGCIIRPLIHGARRTYDMNVTLRILWTHSALTAISTKISVSAARKFSATRRSRVQLLRRLSGTQGGSLSAASRGNSEKPICDVSHI